MNRRVLGAAGATALLILAVALFATIGTAASGGAAAAQYAPASSAPPAISGTPRDGSTLTSTTGQWSSTSAIAYSFQWQRCDTAGANCADLAGATSQTYVVQTADVGKTLRSVVTASNADGVGKANSAPTSVVTAKSTQTTGSAVDASSVVLPSRLVIDAVRFTPARITSRNPVQLRVHIATTEGKVVRGALVYVTAIPFGRINQPAEVSTDANGWATLSLQPTLRLPLREGYLLTIFIRARKQGDSVLAGVSSRRLVSARVGSPAS
jgi:hypothetical protein